VGPRLSEWRGQTKTTSHVSSAVARGAFTHIGIVLVIVWLLLVANAARVQAEAGASSLSCKSGLILHLCVPESPDAKILRTPSGLELRVSEPLLTITSSMVERAVISTFGVEAAPEDRERYKLRETFFWVALGLSQSGKDAVQKALGSRPNADLVVVCNGTVLSAGAVGQDGVTAIDVLIREPSEAAEQFARSFTRNVRFEQRTPPPEQE
jgi:hypothetical protein